MSKIEKGPQGPRGWLPGDPEPSNETEPKSVDSAGDERTANNTNVMRHNYRVLDDEEKSQMIQVKDMGLNFHNFLTEVMEQKGGSPELEQAKLKIREAVMWAVNHLTK